MRQILGKILITFILTLPLFAGVKASVDKEALYLGDVLHYSIEVSGDNPSFPNLLDIAGFRVLGSSSSSSIVITNGVTKKSITKTYTIAPTKSFTIPSYEVKADGKIYKTKEIPIKVLKQPVSKNGDEFVVSMEMDKNNVMVGEPINLFVKFKYKLNAKADKINLSEPKVDDFWIKKVGKATKSYEGDYVVLTYHYILFPQKSGDFKIPPIVANIGKIVRRSIQGGIFADPFFDAFGADLKWKKYISNELYLHVNPLPQNLEVYGDFEISASVDKRVVEANKPVNLTITIRGEGNIDDIKKFDINIPDVVVYADEPKISAGVMQDRYGGEFKQKIALIADKDFTIPPIEFKYYDKNLKKVVTKKTEPIDIKVKGGVKSASAPKIIKNSGTKTKDSGTIKSEKEEKKISAYSTFSGYLMLLVGFIGGVLTTLVFLRFLNSKTKKRVETPLIKRVKKAKDDKELFRVLLPFAKKDEYLAKVLKKLEENIYANGNNKISKKDIIDYIWNEEIE